MNIKTIENFIPHFFEIREFCKKATAETTADFIKKNMSVDNWTHNKNSLLYLIYIKNDLLAMNFAYTPDNILMEMAGIGKTDFDDGVVVACKRTYCLKKYRGKETHPLSEGILPEQIKWSRKNNKNVVLLTFNEENVHIVNRIRNKISSPHLYCAESYGEKFKYYPEKLLIKNYLQHVFYYELTDSKWKVPDEIKQSNTT